MTVDERRRLGLYEAAREQLGDDEATTLMELLPPVGWSDVATKHDLSALEARLDHRFEALDHRFESIDHRFESIDRRFETLDDRFESVDRRFETRLHQQTNRLIMWIVPIVLSGAAMSAAIAAAVASVV